MFAVGKDFILVKIIIVLSVNKTTLLTTVDISLAYLYLLLKEKNLVVEYSTGFSVDNFGDPVCLLKKTLYKLKQSARAWNKHFRDKLKELSYKKCISTLSVYY